MLICILGCWAPDSKSAAESEEGAVRVHAEHPEENSSNLSFEDLEIAPGKSVDSLTEDIARFLDTIGPEDSDASDDSSASDSDSN